MHFGKLLLFYPILIIIPLIKIMQADLPFIDFTPQKVIDALESLKTQPKPIDCTQFNSQLINLFNLMCTNIAINDEDDVLRDSCIGCFQRATTQNNNQPSSVELMNCANTYLEDTRYQMCQGEIQETSINATTGCVTGYCSFVSCIRRVNSDLLLIQCYAEVAEDFDTLLLEEDQIRFIKNVTSCILARARCLQINPITGQPQTNTITRTTYTKWKKMTTTTLQLYNSLQITPDGDVRIIALPENVKIQSFFCITQPNLRQSSWLNFNC